MDLWDLMFALLSFCIALVSSVLEWEQFLCAAWSWDHVTCFGFLQELTAKSLSESQKRL
jgi:hypothetical protein